MHKQLLFLLSLISLSFTHGQDLIIDSLANYEKVHSIKVESRDSLNVNRDFLLNFSKKWTKEIPSAAPRRMTSLPEAQTFILNNGLTVILVKDNKFPVVSYKLFFNYKKTYLGKEKGVDLIFSELWAQRGKKFNRSYIDDKIEIEGAKFKKDYNSIYIEGLSRYKEKNLEIIADLGFNFTYSLKDFENAKEKVYNNYFYSADNNRYIVERVGKSLMFGENHPIGQQYSVENIDSLKLEDVRSYYNEHFNASNAYLVVYGDIKLSELKRLVSRNFKYYKRKEVLGGRYSHPYNVPQVEIDFIENYTSDSLSVWMSNLENVSTYDANWIYNSLAEEILFNETQGLFNTALVNENTIADLEYKIDVNDRYFTISYDVSQDSLVTSLVKSLDYLNDFLNPKNDTVHFRRAKRALSRKYYRDLFNPEKMSDYYLNYFLTGQNRYLMPDLIGFLDTLKSSDFSNSIGEIIKPNKMRLVVAGPPQIAVPELERLGLPINYYNQYAEETFPPSLDRPVSDTIKAEYVLNRYERAIGGSDRLDEIKKILQWWEMKVGNNQLVVKSKYMLPHRRISTYSNKEVIVLKTVFDGIYGYSETGGVKEEFKGLDYARLLNEKSVFPERYYLEDGYKIDIVSQIPIKGDNCYKLRVEAPYGDVFLLYFRIEDGYLIRKEVLDPFSNEVLNYFQYDDFKNFENVVMPYHVETSISGKKVNMVLKKVTFNDKNVKRRNFE